MRDMGKVTGESARYLLLANNNVQPGRRVTHASREAQLALHGCRGRPSCRSGHCQGFGCLSPRRHIVDVVVAAHVEDGWFGQASSRDNVIQDTSVSLRSAP